MTLQRQPDTAMVETIRRRFRELPPEAAALMEQLREACHETVRACQAPLPAPRQRGI